VSPVEPLASLSWVVGTGSRVSSSARRLLKARCRAWLLGRSIVLHEPLLLRQCVVQNVFKFRSAQVQRNRVEEPPFGTFRISWGYRCDALSPNCAPRRISSVCRYSDVYARIWPKKKGGGGGGRCR